MGSLADALKAGDVTLEELKQRVDGGRKTVFCTFTTKVEIVIPHGKGSSSSDVKRLLETALDHVTPMADILQFRLMKTSVE